MATDFMLAYQSKLYEPAIPSRPVETTVQKLELTVLFTGLPETLRALSQATRMAQDLHARIRLVVPQVVPYPLPLEAPPVLVEFNARRFQELAMGQSIETNVEIFLCRDVEVLLEQVLPEHSTVLMGGRAHWWPTAQTRLTRRLQQQGHHVVFAGQAEKEKTHA